jgi:hypothetical protein
MKTLMAYLQIISLIRYVTKDLPLWVEDVSDPNILSFSVDCVLLPLSERTEIPLVYFKYAVNVMQPIVLLLIFSLIIRIKFRKNELYQSIYLTATWLVIWLYYLPLFYKVSHHVMVRIPCSN